MILGAHMSVAGGVENAPLRGKSVGCDTIQLFTKNNSRWHSKPLTEENIRLFRENSLNTSVLPAASHAAYLINLASPDNNIREKSIESFLEEMDRAEILEIPNLVFHPGSHRGTGEKEGIKRVAEAIRELLAERPDYKLRLLLETTAGQGSSIGYKFEHIAKIVELSRTGGERLGVCFDTCHVFASGYDLRNVTGYNKTLNQFESIIGLEKIFVFHINDSKKTLGSRVDRHEHIGKGMLGAETFRLLMNDARFIGIPMILETPKGQDMEEDRANLGLLRSLTR